MERLLGQTMSSTPTGRRQLDKIISNSRNIIVDIDYITSPPAFGKTRHKKIFQADDDIYIFLYVKSAARRARRTDGMLTEIEALSVAFGHEIEHTTDESLYLDAIEAPELDRERKPDEITEKMIKEFWMQKPLDDVPAMMEVKAETNDELLKLWEKHL